MALPEARTFIDAPAVRERVPLLLGLVGPSGSGKTYSALRLATGIQREAGGEIWGIDTEARRMLHYADAFKFRHLEFKAPFGPLDYLAAIEHCTKGGAKIIIVDSMSHEHEGPGGVLEQHDAETARLVQAWKSTPDKVKFAAWIKPKAERRRLLNSVVQMPVNFIFCFRAKEKLKILPGKDPIHLGWQAIAGEEFVYEMTMALLLPPASQGVPELKPVEVGEKALLKIPAQFKDLVKTRPLDEELGAELAKWAAGSSVAHPTAASGDTAAHLKEIGELLDKHVGKEAKDKDRRELALESAFGTKDRRVVAKLPADQLQVGLAALRKSLEGLAAMKEEHPEREPGSDDEGQPALDL